MTRPSSCRADALAILTAVTYDIPDQAHSVLAAWSGRGPAARRRLAAETVYLTAVVLRIERAARRQPDLQITVPADVYGPDTTPELRDAVRGALHDALRSAPSAPRRPPAGPDMFAPFTMLTAEVAARHAHLCGPSFPDAAAVLSALGQAATAPS